MLAAVKSKGNSIIKPFLPGTSAAGSPAPAGSFKAAVATATGGLLTWWLPLTLALVAAAAGYYFLIIKKRARGRRRRR